MLWTTSIFWFVTFQGYPFLKIVRRLKKESTRQLWLLHHTTLRQYYWYQRLLWSNGFFVCSSWWNITRNNTPIHFKPRLITTFVAYIPSVLSESVGFTLRFIKHNYLEKAYPDILEGIGMLIQKAKLSGHFNSVQLSEKEIELFRKAKVYYNIKLDWNKQLNSDILITSPMVVSYYHFCTIIPYLKANKSLE